jgi:anti-sigma B factor antagonist
MPLTIEIRFHDKSSTDLAATVALGGSLDTATAPELEDKLKPILEGTVSDLIFDLARLQFISSAGLRVFAAARKSLRERGGQASFVNLQPQISKVFEIVAALPGMAVFANEQELDRYLARRQRRAG